MKKYYLPIKRVKEETCPNCNGEGNAEYNVSHNETKKFTCPVCKGEGVQTTNENIDIRLPNIFFRKRK